jgi:hypothetical protein
MFVLKMLKGLYPENYAIDVPTSEGFNYTADIDEATVFPNSTEAMTALVRRGRTYAHVANDLWTLVEVTRTGVKIVRVL